jgi:Domain of unknown function (DUF4351)
LQGKLKNKQAIVLDVLLQRFGTLSAELEVKVRQLSEEQLDMLVLDILRFEDESAVLDWISQNVS